MQPKKQNGSVCNHATPPVWKKLEFNQWATERLPTRQLTLQGNVSRPSVEQFDRLFQPVRQSYTPADTMQRRMSRSMIFETMHNASNKGFADRNIPTGLCVTPSHLANRNIYVACNVHDKIECFERINDKHVPSSKCIFSLPESNNLIPRSSDGCYSFSNLPKFTTLDYRPFRSRPLGISQSSSTFNISIPCAKNTTSCSESKERICNYNFAEKLKRNKSFCNLNEIEKMETEVYSDKFVNYFLPGYVPERTVSFTDLRDISLDQPLRTKIATSQKGVERGSSNLMNTSDLKSNAGGDYHQEPRFASGHETKNFYLTHIRTGNVAMARQRFESLESLPSQCSYVYRTQSLPKNSHFPSAKDTEINKSNYGVEWKMSGEESHIQWKSVQQICEKFEKSSKYNAVDNLRAIANERRDSSLRHILNSNIDANRQLKSQNTLELESLTDYSTNYVDRSRYSSSPELTAETHSLDISSSSSYKPNIKKRSSSFYRSAGARIRDLITRFEKHKCLKTCAINSKRVSFPSTSLNKEFDNDFYKRNLPIKFENESNVFMSRPFIFSTEFSMNRDSSKDRPFIDNSCKKYHLKPSSYLVLNQEKYITNDSKDKPACSSFQDKKRSDTIQNTGDMYKRNSPASSKDQHVITSMRPESQHQYQETEVNIHFKSPIRNLEKEYIEEEELRKRQEDAMRKFYIEERQKKQLREAAELEMRRHCDFFTPSQKSPIPLNRYDNPFESSYTMKSISPGSDHPRTLAQVIYPFVAQSTRELSLSKGDIVYINKQIDRNWYEGEHHGFVGIFPVSYVMVIPTERANLQPKKATEGHGVVKYTFRAKTPVELSLFKGERVVLMRRVDRNWYDGRIGTKRGIFPVNYIEVFQEPGETNTRVECAISPKPPASPVYPIINGSSPKTTSGPTYVSGAVTLNDNKLTEKNCVTQSLHVDTYNEPIPYRSLYAYHPQNEDELELKEGDTVYVMEKCDDGWYVGTSLRSGLFGTFPGNYVERI